MHTLSLTLKNLLIYYKNQKQKNRTAQANPYEALNKTLREKGDELQFDRYGNPVFSENHQV